MPSTEMLRYAPHIPKMTTDVTDLTPSTPVPALTLLDIERGQVIRMFDHENRVAAVVVGGAPTDAAQYLIRDEDPSRTRTLLWSQAELLKILNPQTSLREVLRWAGQRRRLRLFRSPRR